MFEGQVMQLLTRDSATQRCTFGQRGLLNIAGNATQSAMVKMPGVRTA